MPVYVGFRGTVAERMARKYVRDEVAQCWNWHGSKDRKGYGQIRIDGRVRIATHVALELAGKPRPADKRCALHTCDNPACVNPDHLWWGTLKENTADMMAKGRANQSGLEIGREWMRQNAKPAPRTTCTNCGCEFETTKAQLRVNVRNYCSQSCCWSWQRANFTGTARTSWSDAEAHAFLKGCGAPCRGELA